METPEQYIAALPEPRRGQIQQLHDLIRSAAPDLEPHMRSGMIAYGTYHYRYPSGREGDWFVVGLASNKRYISVYISATTDDGYLAEQNRHRLPNADIGKSCIRIKTPDDIDLTALADIVSEGARLSAQP